MLNFKKLEIDDKEIFKKYMSGQGYRHSEASFSNLFIWQAAWDICYAYDDKALYMKMDSDIYKPFMLPPYLLDKNEPIRPCIDIAAEYMYKNFGKFDMKCVIPETKEKIEKECPDEFVFEYDEYNAEYMYNTSDLANLQGKKYHSKRNHINAFLKNHSFEYFEYNECYAYDCLTIHDKWCESRDISGTDEAEEEFLSTQNAIQYFNRLDFKGCVIYVDGAPAAFSFGERISEDTAIIHIEKTTGEYDGLYQLINREFVRNCWSDTTYINRAEDMGLEGLRKAKQSYYPAFMLGRYDMTVK